VFGKRGISLNNKFHSSGAGVKLADLQIGMLDGTQLPKKAKPGSRLDDDSGTRFIA
jgi:hypothetical protein